METELGEFELLRRPHRDGSPLQAWDSADRLVLDHLHTTGVMGAPVGQLVVVNDRFGALAVALAPHQPVSLTDSVVTQRATVDNLVRNGREPSAVRWWTANQAANEAGVAAGATAVVVVKIPKSLELLEHQLRLLRPTLSPSSVIVGAGRVKHIHTSTLDTFERVLGPTSTSLARSKSRLIFCSLDPSLALGPPLPTSSYQTPDGLVTAFGLPGVFSNRRLDPGSRLLLEVMGDLIGRQRPARVLDLGCGNGVLGASAAATARRLGIPRPELAFVDESMLAVASARRTCEASFGTLDGMSFRALDRLATPDQPTTDDANGLAPVEQFDLVLNNPPFHQEHAIDELTAWLMFGDAKRVLRPGGTLVVVANRHLGHHARLRKQFGNCSVLASSPKYVVLEAHA